jgi:cell division protein FtsB
MAGSVPIPPAPPTGSRALVWLLLISGTGMVLYGTAAVVSKNTGLVSLIKYRWEGRDLGREKSRLKAEIDRRRILVEDLRTDPFALERIAREAEHRVRPGEILVLPRTAEKP